MFLQMKPEWSQLMRWMEFIKVQTAKSNVREILLNFVTECKECQELVEAKVFNHTTVNDCSLCLIWDTDSPKAQGSIVGLTLSGALKQFGLVDHSVWVEETEIEEKKS